MARVTLDKIKNIAWKMRYGEKNTHYGAPYEGILTAEQIDDDSIMLTGLGGLREPSKKEWREMLAIFLAMGFTKFFHERIINGVSHKRALEITKFGIKNLNKEV